MNGISLPRKALLSLFAFALLSCDEVFPPYEEPQHVLQADVNLTAPDTVDLYLDAMTTIYYLITPMVLSVTVRNTHNDLLEGDALVQGRVVIQSFGEIPRTAVVPLSLGNLRTPPVFQGRIALGPDRKAEFSQLWVPQTTDEKMVFEGWTPQPAGERVVYGPISFKARAEVQLFERVQPVRSAEYDFARVFRVTTN